MEEKLPPGIPAPYAYTPELLLDIICNSIINILYVIIQTSLFQSPELCGPCSIPELTLDYHLPVRYVYGFAAWI